MKFSRQQARFVDAAIVIGGTASGLLNEDPAMWYRGLLDIFLLVWVLVLPTALLIHVVCLAFGKRIQDNNEPKKYLKEAWDTSVCMYVVALLCAWPWARIQQGKLTAYVWTLEESTMGTGIIANAIYLLLSFLIVDIYTYWKHRLLHTPMFFAFHAEHHSFHDPSSLGSFAVGPFEALLTFGLILFDCLPQANMLKFYVPLHLTIIIGFTVLNLYLHAGYTLSWIEAILPKLFVNTSGYHNVHHAKGNKHFAELLTIWDYLLKTGETFYNPPKKVKN